MVAITRLKKPSLTNYLIIIESRIIRFIPFPKVLSLCEMQTVSSRIWTRVSMSISYDCNDYTMNASKMTYNLFRLLHHAHPFLCIVCLMSISKDGRNHSIITVKCWIASCIRFVTRAFQTNISSYICINIESQKIIFVIWRQSFCIFMTANVHQTLHDFKSKILI